MSNEIGMKIAELQLMSNEDILIKTRVLEDFLSVLENIIIKITEADKILRQLSSIKHQYKIHTELLNSKIELEEQGSLFNNERLEQLIEESKLYTKRHIIENFKKTEQKYDNIVTYYQSIDKKYYSDMIITINNEMFR